MSDAKNLSYLESKEKLSKELSDTIFEREKINNKKLNEIEKCVVAERLATKYIKKYKTGFLKYSIINILKTLLTPFSEEIFFIHEKKGIFFVASNRKFFEKIKKFLLPSHGKWFLPLIYLEFFLFIIFFVGFVSFVFSSFFNKNLFCILSKVLPFIVFFVFISLAAGFARLRLPVEPLVIILSSKFWLKFFRANSRDFLTNL